VGSYRLVYKVGDRQFEAAPDTHAGYILGVLAKQVPAAVKALCDHGTRASPTSISGEELLGAVEQLLLRFDADASLLCQAYAVSHEYVPGQRARGSFSRGGGIGGLILPGEPLYEYSIMCGPGKCEMTKSPRRSPGMAARDIETVDVRTWKQIATENCGTVRIHRKRIKTGLREYLSGLRDFLIANVGGKVDKWSENEPDYA
jgi:hypothetical protein